MATAPGETQRQPDRKRREQRLALSRSLLVALLSALVVIALSQTSLWQDLNWRSFDLISTTNPPRPYQASNVDSDPRIVIVGIDDVSMVELNRQWPWPRDWHGQLASRLRSLGAKVVAFDLILDNPSPDAAADARLASALREDNVLAADVAQFDTQTHGGGAQLVLPLPLFTSNGAGYGIAKVEIDTDGVIRRMPPAVPALQSSFSVASDGTVIHADHPIENFAAEILWRCGTDPQTDRVPPGALIQYLGPAGSYRRVSYSSVLTSGDAIQPGLFDGKIVIVGRDLNAAADLQHQQADSFATSFTTRNGLVSAGVEVHATILDNLRFGLFIRPLPPIADFAAILIAAFLGLLLLRRIEIWRGIVIALFGASALLLGSYAALRYGRIWLPPLAPIAALVMTVVTRTGEGFLQERKQRRFITMAFGQYLSPDLVAKLADDPEHLKLGGESRELTVLFCDIRGFTTISEGMKDDPQRLTRLINRVLNTLTEAILAQGGYIDKYIGDCVMALWNAPLDEPDHAIKALRAAQHMLAAMDELNLDLQLEAKAAGVTTPDVHIGIGINTGICVVGNVGAEKRFNYSALGDAVNLASRLESATKECGVDVVIGETTANLIGSRIALREIGVIHVKGKSEDVRAFTLASPDEPLEPHL